MRGEGVMGIPGFTADASIFSGGHYRGRKCIYACNEFCTGHPADVVDELVVE